MSLESDPFEVAKAFESHPKFQGNAATFYIQRGNTTTTHQPDTMNVKRDGKSLILRRPKYRFAAYPNVTPKKGDQAYAHVQRVKPDKDTRRKIHGLVESGKKSGKVKNLKVKVEKGMSIASDPFEVAKNFSLGRIAGAAKPTKVPKPLKQAQRVTDAQTKGMLKDGQGRPRLPGGGAKAHADALRMQSKVKKNDDPFELEQTAIAKAANKNESTTGRKVTAALFPGYHGAIAGKKGRKVKAFGNEYLRAAGGGMAGQVAGAGLGAAVTRGKSQGAMLGGAVAGGMGGSATGAVIGNNVNQRKGHLKGRG